MRVTYIVLYCCCQTFTNEHIIMLDVGPVVNISTINKRQRSNKLINDALCCIILVLFVDYMYAQNRASMLYYNKIFYKFI